MLTTLKTRGLPALWPALIGAMLSVGLLLPIFSAVELSGSGVLIGSCLMTALGLAVIDMGGRFRWIGLGCLFGLLFLFSILSGTLANLRGMAGAAIHLIRGNIAPMLAYGPEVALVLGALATFGGWSMARQSAGFYPSLSLSMVILLLLWFSGRSDVIWLFAPALVALCMMFARSASEETPLLRVLVASTLAVVLALAATPVLQFRSPRLERFADDLRTYITDTLFFTEPRSVYSIQADGYKPLETRLGGPVELTDRPVMTVETPTALLLRGVVYNEYTGLNWRDSLSSRRYLYTDIRSRSVRVDALDENRPSNAIRQSTDLFRLANITITMNSGSASTLFVPQRVDELHMPMSLVPYFNLSGEMYITKNLGIGDSYTLTAPVINAGDSRLSYVLSQAAMRNREERDMSSYMGLHAQISQDVYALVEQITASAGSPYDRARAIQDYLRKNHTYTLTPAAPPENQDFVSYFLLRSKEGYCTYFASAMAVMGRIAGLPTRYVEGYIAEPSGGVALVTSKNAHAWTEVYFDGFGWVAFDATPQGSGGGGGGSGGGSSDNDPQWQDETEEDTPQSDQETPAPPGGDGEENRPDEDPQGDLHATPTPSPQDEHTSPEEQAQNNKKRGGKWWLWLLLIAILGLLGWRWYTTRPDQIAAHQVADEDKLMTWYRALLGLLGCANMPARQWETPLAYATRVEKGIPPEAGFSDLAVTVMRLGYARSELRPADVRSAAACYTAVWRSLPLAARAKWLARRMLHGIGSIEQIP